MTSPIPAEDTLAASFKFGSSFLSTESHTTPLRTFLFGYPISHSLAPLLHATLFDGLSLPWTYELHETQDATEFLPALKQENVVGCAVTMPYKVALMSSVDEVTEEGRVIGAINTVFLRKAADGNTRYIGTNTDCIGVRDAFLQNFSDVPTRAAGKPALVIGGGGACRAAIFALWKLGASKIYLVNRLESEVNVIMDSFKAASEFDCELVHVSSTEQAAAVEAPVLVVGTVPDFPPKEPGEIQARSIVNTFLGRPEKGYILEMCYSPKPETQFFELGENAGWQMLHGTESMIWQGVAQQVLWAEVPLGRFKLGKVHKAISEALRK